MGSTTIFHPSNDEILCVPRSIDPHRDHTHSASASTAASGVPSSSSAASSASSLPNPSSAKALSRARPRQEPQPPSAGTAKSAPPSHSRNHRLSLATIAHDKTSTALANLSARPPPAASSLRTSPSSGNLSDNRSTSNPQFASPRTNRILNGEKTSETQTNPFAAGTDSSSSSSSRSDIAHSSTGGSAPSEAEYPLYYTVQPSSRAAAFTPCYSPQGSFNKMHQTSSRLLRMTDEERPFTRDFKDLFSTLMVSLPLSSHRVRLQRIEHTFTSEEAINNLGSLKFSQSNRMPDPKDPSRIVTTTTTTTFSMAKEMARSVCQRFMDARFVEPADGKAMPSFPLKSAVWQLTPKGMHILQRFCQRNGINQRHVLDVLESARNTMQLVILERDATTDKLSHDRATIEVIFRRFAGQDGPNIKSSTSHSDSDSLSDYHNGLVGVKMARERKILDKAVHNTFTGKAAVDWLMDCCETVDRRETFEVAELFVKQGLIWAVVEDKVYLHQNPAALSFQPTKNSIYALTEQGQHVVGWVVREKSGGSGDAPTKGNLRDGRSTPRDSNNNRLNIILHDPALRLLFREFLRDTHCEENLAFYLDVKEFNDNYDRADKSKALQKLDAIRETLAAAYGLYNAFLAPGSPCELNIDHNLRNSLAGRMTRAVGDDESMLSSLQEVVDLFKAAQTSVFKLMSSDSVPKFLKEPKYASVLREHNFDHVVASSQPIRTMSRSARDTRP